MNKKTSSEKVRKGDYNRVLITETLPYETPIIFSNDGLHRNIRSNDKNEIFESIKRSLILQPNLNTTIPYKYKVKKTSTELRTLSIIHPSSQIKFTDFYKEYAKLICHYCSLSNFSIRAPYKVASTVFYKNTWENTNKYKRGGVTTEITDKISRHSSSFFVYSGHDRLYKFYNSDDFLNLEKDYSFFLTLDVSKCFDSIYTHSIAWATKSKPIAKKNLSISTTFGSIFDTLMQRVNHNETNGILIGPEVSRIFAEIILQRIDLNVELRLAEHEKNLKNNSDYTIRRYVDDIFIFTRSELNANLIAEIYTEELNNYNLHVNKNKVTLYTRPFFSTKSKVISETNLAINDYCEKFLTPEHSNERLIPEKIFRPKKLIKSFIDCIKSICSNNSVNYDAVSSYIISAFTNRIKKIINIETQDSIESPQLYCDAILNITEVMFFFYTAAPSVSSSYKLSTSIILTTRFTQSFLSDYRNTLHQRIFELTSQLLLGDLILYKSSTKNFVYLEALNIVLASTELGNDYLLPANVLDELLSSQHSYYDIVSCLYYIKNNTQYASTRNLINQKLDSHLSNLSDIKLNAEKASIFLDSISCPYIEPNRKSKYIKRYHRDNGLKVPNDQQIAGFLKKSSSLYWFVNWKEIDLLNMLEKKELKAVY